MRTKVEKHWGRFSNSWLYYVYIKEGLFDPWIMVASFHSKGKAIEVAKQYSLGTKVFDSNG